MNDAPESTRLEIAIADTAGGERLDRALAIARPELSRSRIKALIEQGHLKLGGGTIMDPALRVKPGQVFTLEIPPAVAAQPQGQAIDLDIVYEDDDLIVIDKPAGMVVHPAPGNPDNTLVNALIAHCGDSLSGIGGERRPGIVHRIDKDTSGLIVAAKNDATHQALSAAFEKHDIERAYLALVWGVPSPTSGEITGNIGRHPVDRKRMAVVSRGGKPATTRYRVLKSFGLGAALVECRLLTGRTHQIRVHMTKLGHPLIGDPVYGKPTAARRGRLPRDARAAAEAFPRQALHATLLGFDHPRTGQHLVWRSESPEDFRRLERVLGAAVS
ncbi:RluA family pseudouridine synthase [Dongia sedimenti]|uniref:Pseudouridine synthase n=1 Tax=Dongia sedimenti TaxID=3064282 RepID=A0ABU0YIJ6_9PROT|nr:RluA family pseudouridine synthase [Rhodospirillaceae bacterium R-7]